MKISANSIRLKNILEYKSNLWIVSKKPEHTKPGKGPAYIQVEMKNLKTGIKINERFNSSDQVERAILEQKEYEYLYKEGMYLVLMNHTNFEQINVSEEIVKEQIPFLSEGMMVTVEFYNDEAINITLPSSVVLEIIETDPNIKGSTVTSSYKPALLSNGVKIKVPPYLDIGEKVVVRVEDATFVERAK